MAAIWAEEWKTFYGRVLDYLENLDVDIEAATKQKGMETDQMMFTG